MFRKQVKTFLVAAVLTVTAVVTVCAQPAAAPRDTGRRFSGETLRYEGKLSLPMKLSFTIADLVFTASDAADGSGLAIKADATSRGTLTSLFRFSFQQRINSDVDLDEFRAARTEKHDVQKDRIRDSEAVFDYGQRRVTFIETDPNDKMRAPRRIASDITDPTHDIVSAIYFLRLQDLAVGKTFEVQISDSGLVYRIPVKVTAREKKDSPIGKFACWRVEPQIFGPGRLIEKEGKLIIWMTADDRRIPVAAKIDSGIGTVNIKLKEFKQTPSSQTALKLTN